MYLRCVPAFDSGVIYPRADAESRHVRTQGVYTLHCLQPRICPHSGCRHIIPQRWECLHCELCADRTLLAAQCLDQVYAVVRRNHSMRMSSALHAPERPFQHCTYKTVHGLVGGRGTELSHVCPREFGLNGVPIDESSGCFNHRHPYSTAVSMQQDVDKIQYLLFYSVPPILLLLFEYSSIRAFCLDSAFPI